VVRIIGLSGHFWASDHDPFIIGLSVSAGEPELNNESQTDLDRCPIADLRDFGESVPVIDIAGVTQNASGDAAHQAVDEIANACREWGFFQVINHGISDDLIDTVWQQTRDFFAGPAATKEEVLRNRDNPWGYYNNELTKNQRDKKEVFDFTTDGTDPIYGAENRWPDVGTRFCDTMRTYLDACTRLSLTLLEAFCIGLNLPADFMHDDFAGNHTGFIRLNYYPVADPLAAGNGQELPNADMGVHHHSDAGALTLLLQDDVGGLQVYRDGFWHDIPSVPGAFVINTGDMMQVWSNDIYQAAIHRVLAMHSRDRYSIPFFFNPAAATEVSPLPSVVTEERPPRYRSINWSEFRGKRTDGDYADYGPEVQIAQYRIQT
jgi:isopenicillin N synthase-like dioxygenase